jgi:hypothetical protein
MTGNPELECPNCGRFAVREEQDFIGDEVIDISLITISYLCLCCGYTGEHDNGNESNFNKRRFP